MAVNVSLIRPILTCSHEHNSKRELLRQPYLHQPHTMENISNVRFRIPVYDGINDSTVTYENAQRTHLTERRTQAIAQRGPWVGFTGLTETDTDPTGNTQR